MFSQDRPRGEIRSWLEPHGLLHQKFPDEHITTAFFFAAFAQVSFCFVSPCYVLARKAGNGGKVNGSNRTGCLHQKLTCASMAIVF